MNPYMMDVLRAMRYDHMYLLPDGIEPGSIVQLRAHGVNALVQRLLVDKKPLQLALVYGYIALDILSQRVSIAALKA